jgi:uncharacterized protein YggT (Ycf19 family)
MKNWYYHVPDMLLAVATYLIVARLALLPLGGDRTAIVRALRVLTTPVVAPVAAITPRMLPAPAVLLAAVAWLYAARVLLRAGMAATGLRLG